jgi:hypothetical protein
MHVSVSLVGVISHRYSKSLSHPVRTESHTCIVCESWDHVIPASPSVRKTPHLSPYQRRSLSQLLQTKDKAFAAYKSFAAWVKTQHGVRVKRLRSDRGGEYTSGEFSDFLKSQGTECRLTTHDTPQHNGVSELLNCRILE